jgi:hypothetical protein
MFAQEVLTEKTSMFHNRTKGPKRFNRKNGANIRKRGTAFTLEAFVESLESRLLLSAYYVSPSGSDAAAGGSSAPWKTLQKAANNAKAGDVVHVGAGTYTSGMNFFGKAGGTAGAPISFLADPGAVITHCATSGLTNDSLAAINVESTGGYYVFKGFTVDSDGSMQRAGIRVAYSDHVQVLDNTVNAAFIGIFASNATDLLVQGNTCTNATDQHGIYVSLNTHGVVVRGNTLRGNNWDGLHMNALNGSPNDGALVEDNVIYGNSLSGMDIEGVTNATFRNNLIYGNTKHGITIHSQDQANTPVAANNTFVNNTIAGNGMFAVQVKAEDAGGETFFNNILGSSSSTYGSIGTSGSTPTLVSDYNVVLDNFSQTLGTTKMTLAQWQSSTGQDRHSVIASPSQLFVNPAGNDYHLKSGSPAIDLGVGTLNARSAPTADIADAPRPQGASWDAGAYEYPGSTNTDTTPPVISNVASSNTTAAAATVTWSTNEPADTQVQYGTTTAYGASSPLNATDVTAHSVALSGLAASTVYHYRVLSRDAAGNLATSGDFTFATAAAPDTTPPVISGVTSSNMTSTAASVGWNTNEASDTQVDYGTSTSYGASTVLNSSNVTSHGVALSGLASGTLYHYRVRSRDAAGNLAVSGDFTFTTAAVVLPGQLSLASATYTVVEGGGSILITVTRTGGTGGAVSIGYATSDGTALAGGDYTATSGVLTFADGETQKTFGIPIVDDAVSENAETFNLTLSNPTGGATLGAQSTAIVTIQDDDVSVPPVVNPLANNIAYDADGNLIMAYFDAATNTLKYAVRDGSGAWSSIQVVDSTPGAGTFLSLAMDPSGQAGIAYYDATNADLKYAHFNGSTWDVRTVDSTNTTGYYPSLQYGPTGMPAISYYSKSGWDLKIAQGGSTGWTIRTVDSLGDVGRYGTMALNPKTGRWAIAYEDTTHGTFRYAQQTKRGWSKATADGGSKSGGGYISL